MSKKFFISTSIPYVNGAPHVGHALEFVEADIIARYRRLMGDEVFFVSGTDDNSLKNVLKAEENGEEVEPYVRRLAGVFKDLGKELGLSNDYFIETSADPRHAPGAQKLWEAAMAKGDIYKKAYEGIYCVGCEEFKTEKDLVEGKCPEHPNMTPEVIKEENYFFALSRYQEQLLSLIESDTLRIIPESRKNEVLAFIRGGLEDFSISRSRARARNWGVAVPGDPDQVMYVWYDALANYITALGYAKNEENFQKFWTEGDERVHVIGKGINRFHTIYWPAMLLSAGVALPTEIFIHGYITAPGGQKMSKSLGNGVDPFEVIKVFGTEATRYFFARHINPFEDSPMDMERVRESYNANLANGLGNLVSRIMRLAETHLETAPAIPENTIPDSFKEALDRFAFHEATDIVWSHISKLDERIQSEQPFKVIKEDRERGKEMIRNLVVDLYTIGRMLNPLMPETSATIKTAIKENKMPPSLFLRKE